MTDKILVIKAPPVVPYLREKKKKIVYLAFGILFVGTIYFYYRRELFPSMNRHRLPFNVTVLLLVHHLVFYF
jgi:hypothetical protein